MLLRNLTPAAIAGCLVLCLPAQGVNDQPGLRADRLTYEDGEAKAIGNVRITHQGTLLTANEVLYNQAGSVAGARGGVTITSPSYRLVGERASYKVEQRQAEGQNIRFGRPPFYAEASHVEASETLIEMEDAVLFFGEPRPGAINLRVGTLRHVPEETLRAKNVTVRVGRVPVFFLPVFSRRMDGLATEVQTEAGYTGHVGAYGYVATRTPIFPALSVGPEVGYYSRRGFLFGPGLSYDVVSEEHRLSGNLSSGYIRDRGNTGFDRLGRPVDDERYFAEWRHKHLAGENFEFTGQMNLWSDSEITRDFRSGLFRGNQFPDNFFEAAYLSEGYVLSAFTRASPHDFQVVQERLPEVRFDLLPRRAGEHLYHQLQASAAVLREDNPLGQNLRSDRLDLYYGLHWPIHATEWLTVTPKAGARITHYQRALEERDDYTRALGEVGLDAEMNAYSVFDYTNKLWRIDGIRHVVKPRIHYRYIPEAESGARFIPEIDQRAFATQLQPIDLGQIRHIDDLEEIHTLRYGLENIFQTRHPSYGSTDLLSVLVANDLRFSRRPDQRLVSDVHAQLAFTPVYWFRLDALQRYSPADAEVREFAAGITITDARFWSMRVEAEYLENLIEQYSFMVSRRLNEKYTVVADLRYDALLNSFSRQTYGIIQTLYRAWDVRYQLHFRSGTERESDIGAGISFSYRSL